MKKTALLVLLSGLMACQSEQKNQDNDSTSVAQEKVQQDTLTYTYDSVKVYSKTPVSPNKEITDTAKASFVYPVFQDSALNKMVEQDALYSNDPDARKYTSYRDLAKSFMQEFDAYDKENDDRNQIWFRDATIKVLPQWKSYMALEYSFIEYMGGAHPNSMVLYKNYNSVTKKQVKLDDLIQPAKRAELTSIAEKIFRKNENLSATARLSEQFFFDKGVFALNDNFYLSKDGLHFLYNAYEIKAYAYGRTSLVIPYASIKHILAPNPILPGQS